MSALANGNMSPTKVLACLDCVVREGDRWGAECPSCGGRSLKLAVKDADKNPGVVVAKCFDGCDTSAIVGAIGLTVSQSYPARVDVDNHETRLDYRRAIREAGFKSAVDVVAREVVVVEAAASMIASGRLLDAEDTARLELAVQRIDDVKLVLNER